MADSQLHAVFEPQNPARPDSGSTRRLFTDENGNPSDRCGPDLAKAEPISEVIRRLGCLRNAYAVEFWQACMASGIHVSVTRTTGGEDRLGLGLPLDSQEDLRRPRYEALAAQIQRSERRRQGVINLVNMLGHFADNQPFSSIEEAATAFVAAGGRIWVEPNGNCEETLPMKEDTFTQERIDGFPLRRLLHRYKATLRRHGGRDAIAACVREHGSIHEGSGWIVLDSREGANG